jgi:type IV pilus assembly protein PilX
MNAQTSALVRRRVPRSIPRNARGAALVIAMILIIVLALVGLVAMRGTIMQAKMSSNLYDREQAFQAAEAALRVATTLLPTTPNLIARNCQAGGAVCEGNPFTDPNFDQSKINTVSPASGSSAPSNGTTFSASAVAAMEPQFVIENMGQYTNPSTNLGFGNSANSRNYGVQGSSATATYYRITARSGDPQKVGDRAVVTLQATIKNG